MTSKEYIEMGKMVQVEEGEALCLYRLYSEGDGRYFEYLYAENMPCSLEHFKLSALAGTVAQMIDMRSGKPEKNFNEFLNALADQYRQLMDRYAKSVGKMCEEKKWTDAEELMNMCKKAINQPAPKKRGRPRKEGKV